MKISSLSKWSNISLNWWDILFVKVGIKKGDINLKMKNGLTLRLMNRGEHSDTSVVSDIYFNTPYTKADFQIKDNWTIIDIGANVGIFSTYAIKQGTGIKVFSYEPTIDNFSYLLSNIKQNKLENNIKAFNFAVTKHAGDKLKLYINNGGSGGNSLYSEQVEKTSNVETVLTTSLKKIIEENKLKEIDLLKIDCEGAEYEILLNSSINDLLKVKRIVIELHPINGYSKEILEKFLNKIGFRTYLNSSGMLCAVKK